MILAGAAPAPAPGGGGGGIVGRCKVEVTAFAAFEGGIAACDGGWGGPLQVDDGGVKPDNDSPG